MLFWHNLWPDLFYTLKKSLTICIPFVNSDNLPPYHICTYIIFTFNASLRKYARTWRNTFIPSGRKIQKVIVDFQEQKYYKYFLIQISVCLLSTWRTVQNSDNRWMQNTLILLQFYESIDYHWNYSGESHTVSQSGQILWWRGPGPGGLWHILSSGSILLEKKQVQNLPETKMTLVFLDKENL